MKNKVADKSDFRLSKKDVGEMFNSISEKYDCLDHIMSLGIDRRWRKLVVKILKEDMPETILDIATGTADLAITTAKILKPKRIIGIDIASKMIDVGKIKVFSEGVADIVELMQGDAEQLDFEDNSFDAVMVSFGVRNFEDLAKGLSEMNRVLKKGGKAVILEFSLPENIFIKWFYLLYFNKVVPFIGGLISKNKLAYKYLPGSVSEFPYGENFLNIMSDNGFKYVNCKKLNQGICSIYTGKK